jgi:hypothetical protein
MNKTQYIYFYIQWNSIQLFPIQCIWKVSKEFTKSVIKLFDAKQSLIIYLFKLNWISYTRIFEFFIQEFLNFLYKNSWISYTRISEFLILIKNYACLEVMKMLKNSRFKLDLLVITKISQTMTYGPNLNLYFKNI